MDEEAKRKALRTIPYALYVVGVRNAQVEDPAKDLNAFLGSWVTQCSFKPPLVALGVKKASRSHGMIVEGGVFALNFLRSDQKEVAVAFLKDLEVTDATMGGFAYRPGETGAPVLEDAPAWVECRLVARHDDGGDHDVFVGEVVAAGHREDAPPLTHASTGWHYGG